MSFSRANQDILFYGKMYKGYYTKDEERDGYLKLAAKLYACTDDKEKQRRLMDWWTEGVRDYCRDSMEVASMRELLIEEVVSILLSGGTDGA